jgi:hypothetical protein
MKVAEWIRRRIEGINPDNNARVTPDPGSTKNIKDKTLFDKAQKFIEDIDSGIANTGAISNLASLTKIPGLARTGSIITGMASKSEPLLLALTALDAGRGVFDEDYRKANAEALKKVADDPKSGILGGALDNPYFNTSVALQAFERPVSTGGALIRAAMEARGQIAKSKKIDKETDLKLIKLKKLRKQIADQKAKEKSDRSDRESKFLPYYFDEIKLANSPRKYSPRGSQPT